jgi:hypothetical protein
VSLITAILKARRGYHFYFILLIIPSIFFFFQTSVILGNSGDSIDKSSSSTATNREGALEKGTDCDLNEGPDITFEDEGFFKVLIYFKFRPCIIKMFTDQSGLRDDDLYGR